MPKVYYVADHDTTTHVGGAEKVDENIYKALGIEFIKSGSLNSNLVLPKATYILGNATFLNDNIKSQLINSKNYIIFEHDYKMHHTRQPNRYENCIFPIEERINLDYYANAKVVFLQTNNHLDGFVCNGVKGNLRVLSTSIWSQSELDLLRVLSSKAKQDYRYCILEQHGLDKGADIAKNFCSQNDLDYVIIPKLSLNKFYYELSKYSSLVYFPRVRESFCRLVVEARCLQMNIITNKTYGAVCEPWFNMSGINLIEYLTVKTRDNLKIISEYL